MSTCSRSSTALRWAWPVRRLRSGGSVGRSTQYVRHAAAGRLRGDAGADRHPGRQVRSTPDAARRDDHHGLGPTDVLPGGELPPRAGRSRSAGLRRCHDVHLRPPPGGRLVPGPPLPGDGHADQRRRHGRQHHRHRATDDHAGRPRLGTHVRDRRRDVAGLRPAAASAGRARPVSGGRTLRWPDRRSPGAAGGPAGLAVAGRPAGLLDPPVDDGRPHGLRRALGLPVPDPGAGLRARTGVEPAAPAGARRIGRQPDSRTGDRPSAAPPRRHRAGRCRRCA